MVRTRIAPSPTGFAHIGTIYQVLFDWAYAKKNNGRFIMRLEDTDLSRFVAGAEEAIYESLDWFGLTEDESPRKGGPYGPYKQSERLAIYKKYAEELVSKDHAYYCTCSKERLEEVRKKQQMEKKPPMYDGHCRDLNLKKENLNKKNYVIRLKVPKNKTIIVIDEIRGKIKFGSDTIDDQVLIKSDGYATYHLAAIVDDHLMKITHVVRGEEWLTSAPKHFLIYDYFGWDKPKFFHTAILRNPDKSKLSKRHGHTSVQWYKEQGYLPEAILNFLALMGWTHPQKKEIFNLDEFTKVMDLKDMRAVGPVFDINKLDWINGEYLRKLKVKSLKLKVIEFIGKNYPEEIVERTIPLMQERMKKLSDYLPLCEFFFQPPATYAVILAGKKEFFGKIHQALEKIVDWKASVVGEAMQKLAQELKIKNSQFFMDLRIAITGKKISPPLNESMEILGKEECLKRIKKIIA